MSHNITVSGGTSVRLPTAGKYCDRDIIITAEGDGGYERGYAEGETAAKAEAEAHNEEILTDCNAVLPTKGVETADTLEQVPQRIGEIDAEGAELWKYVHGLYTTFQNAKFPSGYEMTLNVPNFGSAISQTFYGATGIRKLTIVCGREDVAISSYFGFGLCVSIEEIDLSRFSNDGTVKLTKGDYLFYGDQKLREIKGVLDFSASTTAVTPFFNCFSLEEVRFVEGSVHISLAIGQSQNLSADSIQSIIDGLADLTGATAQTLTLHKDVGNKLTEAQKATITAKNWTLVY
jgi:hypothetical protein